MSYLTRIAAEMELSIRCGGLMALVGQSPTPSGSNPLFGSALGFAASCLSMPIAAFGNPSDADLAGLDEDHARRFLDLAEYRTLSTILGNWIATNLTVGYATVETTIQTHQSRLKDLEQLYIGYLTSSRASTMVGPGNFRYPTPGLPGWGIGAHGPWRDGGYGYGRDDH